MDKIKLLINKFCPAVPKRALLFVAAIVWTFAGGMLLGRGFVFASGSGTSVNWILPVSVVGGIVFYMGMFNRISAKHTKRILKMEKQKACVFFFFNLRSYIMMFSMISMGILLRSSGWIDIKYLALIYITMGIPLFLSSLRFYYTGAKYRIVSLPNEIP